MKKITTLLSAIIFSTCAIAQIPNAGFETWMNMGSYTMPDQWDNLNAMTSSMSTYTCMQGTPGNPGTSYLKLVSKSVMGMGVMPGVAVSGTLDMTDMMNIKPKSGFPFSSRPAQLTGSWQYMAMGSDAGFVSVLLTKWNSTMNMRDTVATSYQSLSGMAMSWATFTMNLTYMSTSYPDSAIIFLSSSNVASPVANSYLYVDNLAFAGSVPTAVNNITSTTIAASIYPNPATNFTNVSFSSIVSGGVNIKVADLNGRTWRTINENSNSGRNTYLLNISEIPKGIYLVNISNGVQSESQKLVIE